MENHKSISEYFLSAFQISDEKGENGKDWISEPTETLKFFIKEKRNIEKYAAHIVFSYEQRMAEKHKRISKNNGLCISPK